MAKSTQQKQQEALQRKRANIPKLRQRYLDDMAEVTRINTTHFRHGLKDAVQRAKSSHVIFINACAEATVDHLGNPLEDQPKQKVVHQYLKVTEGF